MHSPIWLEAVVLLELGNFTSEGGIDWVEIVENAKRRFRGEIDVDRRSVERTLARLEEEGLVVRRGTVLHPDDDDGNPGYHITAAGKDAAVRLRRVVAAFPSLGNVDA